ncbi:site-specific DNA-methyltransferase [Salinarimonas ramus]|nr:site-specific DNA-methyltransferase [Salinarimonas ramus]
MPDERSELEEALDALDRDDLVKIVRGLLANGVALSFHGKRTAVEIARRVRPRVTRREPKLHVGSLEDQCHNLLVEGENLQAMVTLYKFRGQVDLIVTDPPYNTGGQFRYNDRWDSDPNDPDLGTLVAKEDGSRHTKWIKAMMPRLQMMKAMLKPGGVVAICIDDNELFHLGMMMDEVFGEENRLAIINWQKTTPKNSRHVSTTTDYVLVYSKDKTSTRTELLARSEKADRRFGNRDGDLIGQWKQGDLTGKRSPTSHQGMIYAIQSPFTGELHYPLETRHWAFEKATMKAWLGEWGSPYEERDLADGKPKALVIKGAPTRFDLGFDPSHPRLVQARDRALERLSAGNWPKLYFGVKGDAQPMLKVHASHVKAGAVPTTFWMDEEDPDRLVAIGSVSWAASESGRSREGIEELDAVIGTGHGFETVKPMSLIRKIIQIWCPPSGLVLDPYAGSGTTGHAVLLLNKAQEAQRRFILIEQGAPENGDKYARTLTWRRLRNAITGERPDGNMAEPLGGGFEYRLLTKTIDARAVMSMKRDELIDVVLTSHWETHRRTAPNLQRLDEDGYQYLIGRDADGEGYFLVWNNCGPVGTLDIDSYKIVTSEAKRAGLKPPFHVYARYEAFQSPNVRFWKIPDKILAHLGLDENDRYNNADQGGEEEAA